MAKNKNWSAKVTRESFALDLEEGVFTWDDPEKIAESLKFSAGNSTRRKATPFASAMSMLNFYINRAGKNLNPKTIITKLRDFSERSHAEKLTGELWGESPLYAFSELDACTTCGACMEGCPMSIEHVKIIMESRRYKTLTLAEIPPSAGDATNKIKNNSNPWGIAQHDRFNWAAGLNLPIINEGQKVDYLYFIGCAGSYDAAKSKGRKGYN